MRRMKPMKIIQTRNYDEMSKAAFNVIADTLKENKQASINTTTGASYDGTFELLVEAINNGDVSIEDSVFTNLDEYVSEREKPFTVYNYMHKNFYDLIKTHPKYIGLLDGSVEDEQAEVDRYNEVLNKNPRDQNVIAQVRNPHTWPD